MTDNNSPLVQVQHLVKHFPVKGSWLKGEHPIVHALDDVSLDIRRTEVLGLAGESGCGKTTLGRCILQLVRPTSGQVLFNEQNIGALNHGQLRPIRFQMQIVFQNPLASLDPRMRVRGILHEPLRAQKMPDFLREERIASLLEQVGLGPQHLDRFPHELSGGQCQRVAIARALSVEPDLLVLDEPTSALDVSVQAQIINLLEELRQRHLLTYLFISHDLGILEYLSHRIGIMYLGKLVELGPTASIFSRPRHPYTQALLTAVPKLSREKQAIIPLAGTLPSPLNPPKGCRFHTRCPLAQDVCRHDEPPLREIEPGHQVACHFV
ncbi:MAG: hypothetical protein DPW16_17965 [Chloroflexi bacterium]|nr:hypothetical protein [Chloroflexota bacterium]